MRKSEQNTRELLGKVYDFADDELRKNGWVYPLGLESKCHDILNTSYFTKKDILLIPTLLKNEFVEMIIKRYPWYNEELRKKNKETQSNEQKPKERETDVNLRIAQALEKISQNMDMELRKNRLYDEVYKCVRDILDELSVYRKDEELLESREGIICYHISQIKF